MGIEVRVLPQVITRIPILDLGCAQLLINAADLAGAVQHILRCQPNLLTAISLASPSLQQQLSEWINEGNPFSEKALTRAASYILRAAYRGAPYGMFATVGTINFGNRDSTSVPHFNPTDRNTHTRPDFKLVYEWLQDKALEEPLFPYYCFSQNVSAALYDGFLITQQINGDAPTATSEPVRKAVRVRLALQNILSNIPAVATYAEVSQCFRDEGVAESSINKNVATLIRAAVLVPRIWPSFNTETMTELRSVFSANASIASALDNIQEGLNRFDSIPLASRTFKSFADASLSTRRLFGESTFPLHVDTYCDPKGNLSPEVKPAVETLAKLCASSASYLDQQLLISALRSYYEGHERLIPLIDLIGPIRTLDASRFPPSWKADTNASRDAEQKNILTQIWDCISERNKMLELDRSQIENLTSTLTLDGRLNSIELGFNISSRDRQCFLKGDFLITTSDFPPVIGRRRSASRFSRLPIVEAPNQTYETTDLDVELIFNSANLRSGNIFPRRVSTTYRLALGCTAYGPDDTGCLDLRKLFLIIKNERIVLFSEELNRIVSLKMPSMANAAALLPPSLRFLAHIAEPVRLARPFNGPDYEAIKYLPRIQYGKLVLRRQRLLVSHNDLLKAKDSSWLLTHLDSWGMRPLALVGLTPDSRLPLDVSKAGSYRILIDQLRKTTADNISFEELLPDVSEHWFTGDSLAYSPEFITTIDFSSDESSNKSVEPKPARRKNSNSITVASPSTLRRTAPEWIYVSLYLPEALMNIFILGNLAVLIADLREQSLLECWFFIRYHDSGPHLRIRLLPTNGQAIELRSQTSNLLNQLVQDSAIEKWREGLYSPEYERYGGEVALPYWHHLFEASSDDIVENALAPFGAADNAGHLGRLGAIIVRLSRGVDSKSAMLNEKAHVKLDEAQRKTVKLLLSTLKEPMVLSARAASSCDTLVDLERAAVLTKSIRDTVPSLIHMHMNRCGIRGQDEITTTAILLKSLQGAYIMKQSQDGVSI